MLYLRYSECASGITGQTIVTKSITVGSEQRMEQESKVSITCTEKQTDQAFTITTSNGTIVDAMYSCTPPQAQYNGTLIGWVPEFVLTYVAEVFTVSQSLANQSAVSPRIISLNNITGDIRELTDNPTIATNRRLLSEDEPNSIENAKHMRMMQHLEHYRIMHDSHALHPDNQHLPSAYEVERERHEDAFQQVLVSMAEDGDFDPQTELQRVFLELVKSIQAADVSPAKRRLLAAQVVPLSAVDSLAKGGGKFATFKKYAGPIGMIYNGVIASAALGIATENRDTINEILDQLADLQSDVAVLKADVVTATNARAKMNEHLARKDEQDRRFKLNITTTVGLLADLAGK